MARLRLSGDGRREDLDAGGRALGGGDDGFRGLARHGEVGAVGALQVVLLALGVGNEGEDRVVGGEVVGGGVNGGGAGGVGVDVENVAVGAAEAVLAVAVVLKVPAVRRSAAEYFYSPR